MLKLRAGEVDRIDKEIARLHEQACGAADAFDRELARLKVDELLERRLKLTNGVERCAD